MSRVEDLRNEIEQRKGEYRRLKKIEKKTKREQIVCEKKLAALQKALQILRLVGLKTQQQLEFHISDLVSMALSSVFHNPYKLAVEFVERRGKTECDLYFERDGNKIEPIGSAGGGAVDIASFALRLASWSMQNPKSRNTLILDEPFRFLSPGFLPQASELLKEISKKLDVQIIAVTHSDTLANMADRQFVCKLKKNGVSVIKETGGNDGWIKRTYEKYKNRNTH